MSINLYLKQRETEECPKFKRTERYEKGQRWEELRLDDTFLFNDKGVWRVSWSEGTEISPWLEELVDTVSLHEAFPMAGSRETGIYRHEGAGGKLDTRSASKGQREYWVEIRGKNLSDVRELLHLIRVGKVRPVESFEGAQDGRSRQELEEKLRYTERHNTMLQALVDQNDVWRKKLKADLEQFVEGLGFGRSPFYRKGTVQQRISNILAVHFKG